MTLEDDWIHIDRTIMREDPVCNRQAIEVVWMRQQLEERAHKLDMLDVAERAALAESKAEHRAAELEQAGWWSKYGVFVGVVSLFAGIVVGGAGIYSVERAMAHP